METTLGARLFSIDELATYLGISRRTLLDWNSAGTGPKRIRIGRKVFYRASDVAAWLDSKETL